MSRRLLFRLIHDIALMLDRQRSGRAEQPTTGVLDSQSVKAPGASERGYDAGKKVVGRKRHIDDRAVDENHAGRQYGSCQDPWLYARAAWGVRRRCLDYAFVAWKYSG
jgi:hypothetical protein